MAENDKDRKKPEEEEKPQFYDDEEEMLHMISKVIENDRNLSDFFVSTIISKVESKMEEKMRIKLMFARVAVVVLFVILAPAAWFGIQNAINIGVSEKSEKANKENIQLLNDKLDAAVAGFDKKIDELTNKKFQNLEYTLERKTLILNLISTIIYSEVGEDYLEEDIAQIMKDFKKAQNFPELQQIWAFPILLDKAIYALIKSDQPRNIRQLELWYPKVIDNNPPTVNRLLNFYGQNILGSIYTKERWNPYNLQQFKHYLTLSIDNDADTAYLPMNILYEFRLSGEKKNSVLNALFETVDSLPVEEKIDVLKELITLSDPDFWRPISAEEGKRIADLTNQLFQVYGDELKQIASQASVKVILQEQLPNMSNKAFAEKIRKVYF